MGLFDRLRKNNKEAEEIRKIEEVKKTEEMIKTEEVKDNEVKTPGWDAIVKECERVYPGKEPFRHYRTLISWRLGGKDPLDGISIYDGGDYWHFVTYGLSELYEKETDDREISGYGMEFTFKLKKDAYENETAELECICGILQSLARITFAEGEIFSAYEYIYTGQTQGIDSKTCSNITGFITIPDPEFKPLDTPNGKVEFVEFIGATDKELLAIHNNETDVRGLYHELGTDVTSYNRSSLR